MEQVVRASPEAVWASPEAVSGQPGGRFQMIANAQRMLQQQGYYQGEPDGLLAAPTSAALAEYQRDHGLYETSTIDQPTSQSLGMK